MKGDINLLRSSALYFRKVGICENKCYKIKTMKQNTLKWSRASEQTVQTPVLYLRTKNSSNFYSFNSEGCKLKFRVKNYSLDWHHHQIAFCHIYLHFSWHCSIETSLSKAITIFKMYIVLTYKISENSVLSMRFNKADHSNKSKALFTKIKTVGYRYHWIFIHVHNF